MEGEVYSVISGTGQMVWPGCPSYYNPGEKYSADPKTADNSLQLQQLIDRRKSSREYVLKRYQIKGFPDKSRYLHNFEEQQKLMV